MFFRSAVVVLATLLSFLGWSPQAEHLVTKANTSVVAGRPASIDEHIPGVNIVEIVARHCQRFGDAVSCALDPSTVFYTHKEHNLRTTAGGDWQSSVMGNTSAPPATCNYIALSNDAGAPAAGDTVVASEIATAGLSRAQGTYAHTGGTASFTVQKVFSATGTQASQKAGLLNAGSTGTLCFENTYTQVTVNNGDTLTVTWTINY
jgi:hypothetical protein